MNEAEVRADLAFVRAAIATGVLIRGETVYAVAAVCDYLEHLLNHPIPTVPDEQECLTQTAHHNSAGVMCLASSPRSRCGLSHRAPTTGRPPIGAGTAATGNGSAPSC